MEMQNQLQAQKATSSGSNRKGNELNMTWPSKGTTTTEKVVTSSTTTVILEKKVRRKGESRWAWFQLCFIGRYSQSPLNSAEQGAGQWHTALHMLSVHWGEQTECLQVSWQKDKSGRQRTRWSRRCKRGQGTASQSYLTGAGTPEGDAERNHRITENQIWEPGGMSLVWVLIELKMPMKHPRSNVHGSGAQEKGWFGN